MGTISDKLMRIINTKEDIRQALISKGYDVPTSIPFKEYAKMISDLPCRVDSFPDIEGIVARYSALGLTNEQMAANPVWVDKTGNGHDLQMKNFAWEEGSGISDIYPGALVFDGVDDWAGCDNLPLLPKEKGYSIIALRNWITRYDATQYKRPLISNLDTNDGGAFLIEYRKDENVNDVTGSYNSFTDVYIDDNNPITWQTSSSYNGQIIKKGTSNSTNKLCICKTYFGQLSNYANAAIWEIVILDHDATEEELTKIKDYFVKTYPWLFPDQAWTVVGKTNEDEDRATIANITGNGNDLILSNFGFIEGSGYNEEGEYAGYLVTDGVDDEVRSAAFTLNEDWTIVGNWEFITNENKNAGLTKVYSLYLYNRDYGIFVYKYINAGQGFSVENVKSLKAICSDGRIYLNDWQEIRNNIEQEATISKGVMAIGYFNRDFTKMAFKNLGIYNNQLLSKDDCIKAYNYLQTLKAK